MPKLDLVEAINLTLAQEMARDDRVILLGEDIGKNGGVFRVTDGLQQRFGCERVVDSPLSESGIIGTSVGLAMAGMRPVPEIQFEGFLGPAYDQLVNAAARCRTRNRGAFTCPITVRVPIGGGIHAPELHSDSPEAVYAHTPGLQVVMPSRPDEEYTIPIGQAKVINEGTDVTVVTWGAMVFECLRALDQLPEDVSVELIDLRTIWPIDYETIAASVKKTGRAVVVHEAPKTAGVGAEISSLIHEHCFLHLEAPVQRVTGFDTVMPYYKLERAYLPDADRITHSVRECVAY